MPANGKPINGHPILNRRERRKVKRLALMSQAEARQKAEQLMQLVIKKAAHEVVEAAPVGPDGFFTREEVRQYAEQTATLALLAYQELG